MTIVDVEVEFFNRHGKQVHHIPNIEVKDPVVGIFYAQNCLYVVFQLWNTTATLWIVSWLIMEWVFALVQLLRCFFVSKQFGHCSITLIASFFRSLLAVKVIVLQSFVRERLNRTFRKIYSRACGILWPFTWYSFLVDFYALPDTKWFLQLTQKFGATFSFEASMMELSEAIPYVVKFVKLVKAFAHFVEDRFAICYKQVKQLFIFFNVVGRLTWYASILKVGCESRECAGKFVDVA